MPYNKKGRFQNIIRTKSQSKKTTAKVAVANVPKSPHYRNELQPFIGTCIEIIGKLDSIKNEKNTTDYY